MKLRHKKMARCAFRSAYCVGVGALDDEWNAWVRRASAISRWELQFRSIR